MGLSHDPTAGPGRPAAAALGFAPVELAAVGVVCARGGRTLFALPDLALAGGDALRLTGANGAGKTSLLRLLAGLLAPASGRVRLTLGGTPTMLAAHAHTLSHQDAVKPGLTARDTLLGWLRLQGHAADGADAALNRAGLDGLLSRRAGQLSAGQKRRLNLARLLAAPRPVWLLDEPTAALDAAGQRFLEAEIKAHRAAGGLVIAATHLPLDLLGAKSLDIRADA